MDMKSPDASSCMRNYFIYYHWLLSRHGLSRISKYSIKVAVQHVRRAIRPFKLCNHLVAYSSFNLLNVKKDFKLILCRAQKNADAFVLVNTGTSFEMIRNDNGFSGSSSNRWKRELQ